MRIIIAIAALSALVGCGTATQSPTPSPTQAPPVTIPVEAPQESAPLNELIELQNELNTTDVALEISASDNPAVAGEQLTYRLTVTNVGPNPASVVQVIDNLPADVSYLSDSAGCSQGDAGTLTCILGELLARATATFTITVSISPDLLDDGNATTTLINAATVENLAGPDPDASNNSASVDTVVVAANPDS